MKPLLVILLGLCIFHVNVSVSFADDPDISAAAHLQKGDIYLKNNRQFMALNEYEQAVLKGAGDPELFRKLSLLHYDLGFLDESVSEMEKSVSLSPDSELLRMELGIAYLADTRLDNAKEQFMKVLSGNPGLADAYYYLGEISYRSKEYEMAWLFAKRARCLGHKGQNLRRKLSAVSKEPEADPCVYTGADLYIRQIVADTKNRAIELAGKISDGELFEVVAREEENNNVLNTGGYMGRFTATEVHPGIAQVLKESKPFAPPVVVETESGFHVIQRIAPFDISEWKKILSGAPEPAPAAGNSLSAKATQRRENASAGKTNGLYLLYAGSNRQEQNAIKDVARLLRPTNSRPLLGV